MTTRKNMVLAVTAIAAMAVVSVGVAFFLRGDEGPDFAGMKPQEIKAYFTSDAFQRLTAADQIAIKERAYGPISRQKEQEFIEQARFYSQLPPQQKVRFIDERINEFVRVAERKQQQAARGLSGTTTGTGAKGGVVNGAKPAAPKKTFDSEGYRTWSEKMEPEKRALILELKEAMRQRMEQRGIEISGQGK
jgi:hypothetical protein